MAEVRRLLSTIATKSRIADEDFITVVYGAVSAFVGENFEQSEEVRRIGLRKLLGSPEAYIRARRA